MGSGEKKRTQLAVKLGYEPSDEELGAELGMTAERIARLEQVGVLHIGSLNKVVGVSSKSDGVELEEKVGDSFTDPENHEEVYENRELLEQLIGTSNLHPREEAVLRLRSGVFNVPKDFMVPISKSESISFKALTATIETSYGLTLEEVGMVFGLTRERIRQIEVKVMEKLRQAARNFDA